MSGAFKVVSFLLSNTFRLLIAGLTAWYRDGQVRMEGERTARWDARDRIERYWSVGFYGIVLYTLVAADFTIPGIDDAMWSKVASVALVTALAVFVSVIAARRVVVAVTHDPWTRDEMWTDRVHLYALALVAVLVPMLMMIPESTTTILPIPVLVALTPLITGALCGAWAASVILVDHRSKRLLLGAVRAAFGGSDAEWSRARFVARGKVVTIRHAPASAFSDLRASKGRLAQVAPEWQIDNDAEGKRTSATARRLTLIRVTDDTRASRDIIARSEGLVVSVADHYHPGQRRYALAPGTGMSAYPRVDALAKTEGLRVVEWQPAAGFAIAAPLDSHTAKLRDAFAAYAGFEAHEIEIAVSADEDGNPESVTVTRYPRAAANLDRLKRLTLWRDIQTATIPVLDGYVWRVIDRIDDGAIDLIRTPDLLKDVVTRDQFVERFPSDGDWRQFPVAIRDDGEPVIYTAFSTLIVGQTGAGKGSVIWSVLGGMLDAAKRGEARFYAVDPKGAEAIGDDGAPRAMFEQVATTPDEWADMLRMLVEDMNSRKGKGRKLDPKEYPVTIIFIDELSALSALETDSRRAAEVMANLLLIASQGRSLNFFTLAAVQAPQKDMVGKLREFLGMRVALRTGTPLETDLVLGENSAASGALAHLIPVATPGNNYATAGTGYMKIDGFPDPVRVRFPYTDDATLDRWDSEFRALRESGVLPEAYTEPEEVDPWADQFDDADPAVDAFVETPVAPVAFDLDDLDFDTPVEPAALTLEDLEG